MAQKAVSQFFSKSLGEYPWRDEVESLVATAHARTQINAWSVASGEESTLEDEGYSEVTKGINLCGKFKYKPQGYASLSFPAFIDICLLLPGLWLLTLDGASIDVWRSEVQQYLEASSSGTPQPADTSRPATPGQSAEAGQVEKDEIEWEPLVLHRIHVVVLSIPWLLLWVAPRLLWYQVTDGLHNLAAIVRRILGQQQQTSQQ